MTSVIFIVVLLVLVIAPSLVLFFVRRRSSTFRSAPSPSALSADTAAPSPSPLNTPPPYSKPKSVFSQEPVHGLRSSSFSEKGAHQATSSTRFDGAFPDHHSAQSSLTASPSPHSHYALTRRTLAKSSQNNFALYELEQAYERGMQVTYDPYLDATHLVLTNVVMKTPAEVDLAFQVCTRKIQTALRSRGKERAALLVDIAGLVIGGEATTVWGQSLKVCWDAICSIAGKDHYLAAHYNSKVSPPSQEHLQEKIRRIQILTSAVLNDFQSNIFDTREEAVAFLQRMRALKAS